MQCSVQWPQKLSEPQSLSERFPDEWEPLLAELQEPRYRSVQIFRWIHKRGLFNSAEMTDLPLSLREELLKRGLSAPTAIVGRRISSDKTRKLLLEMNDRRRVETVLIPHTSSPQSELFSLSQEDELDGNDSRDSRRVTQCLSCQVGCAMGCRFCASGKVGLIRQMTAAEIVSQISAAQGELKETERISAIVLMGIGEPLHNYGAISRALLLLSHPDGQAMSLRRMTVSTCGLVPEIDRLAKDFGGEVQLAVSIHSADDAVRSDLMPINRKYPVREVVEAMRRYPTGTHERITVEYTLIRRINDSENDARRLVKLLRGVPVKVNLIPMNPIECTQLEAPPEAAVDAFYNHLRGAGMMVFLRRPRGDDIAAACGQLALGGELRRNLA
ncbi:MAG: 23S rRNA (adenine(2503)-C(2))-methyltransferase RlmN [Deltaproteobacteria bacterium]|nr:23S rRNA (adenine(2503)-C(2))-methyltransferase RlmN [Deltaproteobacteria bacterium]